MRFLFQFLVLVTALDAAPGVVSVKNIAGGGDSILVTWRPNPTNEFVTNYVIWWGRSNHNYYSDCTNAGNRTNLTLRGMNWNTLYHFSMTAQNAGGTSDLAMERDYITRAMVTAAIEESQNLNGPWTSVTQWTAAVPYKTNGFYRVKTYWEK